jgi:hypothetical protein
MDTATPIKRKGGRPPLPQDQKSIPVCLKLRPSAKAELDAVAAETGVPVSRMIEACWRIGAALARHPDGLRYLLDGRPDALGRIIAEKLARSETIVVDMSSIPGLSEACLDLRQHLAAIEARDASRE